MTPNDRDAVPPSPIHVLVVHGMARTRLSFAPLARHLRRAGHRVTSAGYMAALEDFGAVCARMRGELRRMATAGEPYALIGHSLGGLILRVALDTGTPLAPPPRLFIMLGTPNQLPRLAARFRRFWPYRIVNGEAGQLLADPRFFATLPPLTVPYTVIAGTGGRRGRWSPFGDEPNDGTVAVTETLVSPGDAPVLVPARHTFIMNHRDVRRTVLSLLARASRPRI